MDVEPKRELEFFAEGGGGEGGVALEESTEMGLVLETETVRYFLDGEGCGTKERFGTLCEGKFDTGTGCSLTVLATYRVVRKSCSAYQSRLWCRSQ